ncbi:hypothetical protein K1719_040606 [Acacia pycnantha]|nr:hypothetical protein K1719_040606 [Acacia pycnantha]
MANQAASLPTARDSASASVTNKLSPVAAGKRKAMKQRSKMWDHFTKFVNDAGEIKGKCNYCGSVLDCDPKSNGIIALNNYFVNVCKRKPLPEELKQSHLNFNVEDDKFSLVNWKFDQDGTSSRPAPSPSTTTGTTPTPAPVSEPPPSYANGASSVFCPFIDLLPGYELVVDQNEKVIGYMNPRGDWDRSRLAFWFQTEDNFWKLLWKWKMQEKVMWLVCHGKAHTAQFRQGKESALLMEMAFGDPTIAMGYLLQP